MSDIFTEKYFFLFKDIKYLLLSFSEKPFSDLILFTKITSSMVSTNVHYHTQTLLFPNF